MRALLILILIATALWSGYWFVGSQGSKTAFAAWFDQRRAEGWAADYSDLQVQGFPNRFDATFSDVSLADPETGLAWDAPFFQLLALSYQPNHVIAVWPRDQHLATPLGKYQIRSDDMRASFKVQPDSQLAFDRATLTAAQLSVTQAGSSTPTSAQALTIAAEQTEDNENTYRLGLSADGFAPSVAWVKFIDPDNTLPRALAALNADLTVTFDKPWDRAAIEVARPQPRQIKIKLAQAKWGQLEMQMAGELKVDSAGYPEGEITIKARNWRDILKLAVASGALPESLAPPLEDGLGLLSQLAGNPKTLDIPLGFSRGRMLLGPVPIGPAPHLKIR